MNKKQSKVMKKGYREAGQLYWTAEMAGIIKRKNAELLAYRLGFLGALAFAVFVAMVYAGFIG